MFHPHHLGDEGKGGQVTCGPVPITPRSGWTRLLPSQWSIAPPIPAVLHPSPAHLHPEPAFLGKPNGDYKNNKQKKF